MLLAVAALPASVRAQADQPVSATVVLDADRAGLKGIVGHWWYLQRYGDALLDHYVRLGVTNVRLAVDWRDIEELEAGQRNYAHLDPIMDAFADRGIEVIPVVATIPVWASLNPVQCASDTQQCSLDITKLAAFQSTMADLVARYPEVKRWEFWNEPEMWAGLRRPSDFEPWYRAFYAAAKSIDPRLQVAVGTLSGWDFVSRLSPSLPMDAVTIHPYAGDDWGLDTNGIERLHNGLLARGVDVPVWITEYGWAQWMDPVRRAGTLARVFDWMRKQPYIQVADYHMLHDGSEPDECCWGLVGPAPGFPPHEPAYSAFGSIAVEGWQRVPRAHPGRASATGAEAPASHLEAAPAQLSVPVPVPGVSPEPAPAPANAEPLDAATVYYVVAGDTLQSIALDLYGEQDAWPSIYDVNRAIIGPDPDALAPGLTLHVPRRG
jgi:hypothetical protein